VLGRQMQQRDCETSTSMWLYCELAVPICGRGARFPRRNAAAMLLQT